MMSFKKIRDNIYFKVTLTIIFIIGIGLSYTYYQMPYELIVDDELIGLVSNNDKHIIDKHIENVSTQYEKILNKKITLMNDIKYTKKLSLSNTMLLGITKYKINKRLKFSTNSFSINVNDENLAYFKDENEAISILENIKSAYIKDYDDKKVNQLSFVENVKVIQSQTDIFNIINKDSGLVFLLTGNEVFKEYMIKNKERINNYDQEIYEDGKHFIYNEVLNRNTIVASRGNTLVKDLSITRKESYLYNAKGYTGINPILNVKVIKSLTEYENIPFETKYKETDKLYKGTTKIETSGVNGEKIIDYEITYINGNEVKRIVTNEKTIKQPVNEVVLKGTKERLVPTKGMFLKPTHGILSSRYGLRNSGFHRGIDIANDIGTSIYAAEDGEVIFSGWSGNYGYLIKIDHKNGYITYYAHNNSLLVTKGDKVRKGDKIANMGDTGNVTGPHLHFEIINNGKNVDPFKYMKF